MHSDATNEDARPLETKVKITSSKHLILLGQALQAIQMVEVLKQAAAGPLGKMPGAISALALAEKEAAEVKLAMVGRNMIAMTKAGVDVATHSVSITGDGFIVCTASDLVERAEFD